MEQWTDGMHPEKLFDSRPLSCMGTIGLVPNYLLHQHKRKILSPTKSLLPSCELKHDTLYGEVKMFLVTPSNRVLIIIQSSCCHVMLVQWLCTMYFGM